MIDPRQISQFFLEKVKSPTLRDIYFRYIRGTYMRAARRYEPAQWSRMGTPLLTEIEATNKICDAIKTGQPFAAGRIGGIELRWLHWLLDGGLASKGMEELHTNVGLFPNDPALFRSFLEIYGDSLASFDLLGIWYGKNEARLYREFKMTADITEVSSILLNMEEIAVGIDNSWLSSLAGKKVVVISSFASLIKERATETAWNLYWNGRIAWPTGAEFIALPFPYGQEPSTTRTYGNSLQLLESFKETWSTVINGADIVLAGCGGYALPLLAWTKSLGKPSLHLASHVQVLFGIKGGRWDNRDGTLSHLYNDHWIRPSAEQRPAIASSIEGGCYW